MTRDRDVPIRGQMRRRGFRRVAHGLFLPHAHGLTPQAEWRRDLRAWLEVLPEGSVFTGLTAARLLGWDLPKLPEQVPVFAATQSTRRPRRPGLICSRLVRTARRGAVRGLPVDSAEEVLLRCARDLGRLDLRILLESARRVGHVHAADMEALLVSGRPGVRLLRSVWESSTGRSDSAGESVLQEFHDALEISYVAQKELYDEQGQLVAKADLWIVGTDRLHEYDGGVHRDPKVHRNDLRRERGLGRAHHARRGFSLDDLLNHALVTMQEIDRDLGRPSRLRRYRSWQATVDQSLYSHAGRERVMNRWHRQMGVADWSRTAS